MLLDRLSLQTRRSRQELLDFAFSAGLRYKEYPIDKRSGGKRIIEQPARSVKALQRWLEKVLFKSYPVHASAMGYRTGVSIRDNGMAHSSFAYSVRLDFKDFFWSFKQNDVEKFFREKSVVAGGLSSDDVSFIAALVTRNDRLAMGAPSSPTLTNIMMYELDSKLEAIAQSYDASYTRYADDLFFSSNVPGSSYDIVKQVVSCIDTWDCPRLEINHEKTAYLSRRSRRTVTGLVITSDGRVSLGRDRKKMIKALLHKAISGALDPARFGELSGYINWAKSADPEFIASLNNKYGSDAVIKYSNPGKLLANFH